MDFTPIQQATPRPLRAFQFHAMLRAINCDVVNHALNPVSDENLIIFGVLGSIPQTSRFFSKLLNWLLPLGDP